MWLVLAVMVGTGCSALLPSSCNASISLPDFATDTAQLDLVLSLDAFQGTVSLLARDIQCSFCLPTLIAFWPRGGANRSVVGCAVVSTKRGTLLSLESSEFKQPEEIFHFGDRGRYRVTIAPSPRGLLSASVVSEPYDALLPLIVLVAVYVGIALCYLVVYFCVWKRLARARGGGGESAELLVNTGLPGEESTPSAAAGGGVPRSSNRLFAVDTFRGICLVIMIFANSGGGRYWWLEHSVWNGLTVADLVFPWFVFLMGVSLTLSLSSILTRGKPQWGSLFYKMLRRTAILFALGLLVNNCYNVDKCRVPGVLQRFAVSYLVTFLIVVCVPRLSGSVAGESHAFPSARAVYVDRALEWLVVVGLSVAWLTVTLLLPVPGCPTGYLGPGGTLLGPLANCTGGAARLIDVAVFGEAHIYGNPTCKLVYGTGSYDPEGLLGCITSVILCYLGVHCGRVFVAFRKTSLVRFYVLLTLEGCLLAAVGAALAGFSQNNGVIPITKNLWSISFVLVMGGLGVLACALLHALVDSLRIWNGSPFRMVGMNSIALYFGSEVLSKTFPFAWNIGDNATHGMALFRSATGTTLWVIAALYMFWIDFFVKI